MIVRKIREMTDPETGVMVWDKETKAYRRASRRDIVILLRSTAENCCIKSIQQFPFLVNLITDILFNNDHNHRV